MEASETLTAAEELSALHEKAMSAQGFAVCGIMFHGFPFNSLEEFALVGCPVLTTIAFAAGPVYVGVFHARIIFVFLETRWGDAQKSIPHNLRITLNNDSHPRQVFWMLAHVTLECTFRGTLLGFVAAFLIVGNGWSSKYMNMGCHANIAGHTGSLPLALSPSLPPPSPSLPFFSCCLPSCFLASFCGPCGPCRPCVFS